MMDKTEVKFLRAFLIEYKLTQKEFSKEAGICERTLRTALKTGYVSDKTYNKILVAMLNEANQKKMLQIENAENFSDLENIELTRVKVLNDIIWILFGIMAILGTVLILQ